jgi:hypothetical protein
VKFPKRLKFSPHELQRLSCAQKFPPRPAAGLQAGILERRKMSRSEFANRDSEWTIRWFFGSSVFWVDAKEDLVA